MTTVIQPRHPKAVTRSARTTATLARAAILSLVVVVAGCTSPGTFGQDKGGGIGSGSGGGGNNPPPPATPPSTQTPIPANATRVAASDKPGVPLSYTAPESGQVYLLDATDTKLKMNTAILQGQTISTDPANGRVLLGGRELQRMTFDSTHFYEIYYAPR